MSNFELVFFGFALGMDAFSVAVAISVKGITKKRAIKLSLGIGLVHFLLAMIGIFFASLFSYFFSNYYFFETINTITSLIGAFVLILLGIVMLYEGFKQKKEDIQKLIEYSLALLIISISVDALSAGFGLGMLGNKTIVHCLILGIIVSVLVFSGFILGTKLKIIAGDKAVMVGGVILIFLGTHLIIS